MSRVTDEVILDKGMMVVRSVVKRIISRDSRLKKLHRELIGEGTVGLMVAVSKYEPDHKSKASFQTFAYYHVRGAVLNYLRLENKHFNTVSIENDFAIYNSWGEGSDSIIGVLTEQNKSAQDAVIPTNFDRYEKLVIKWRQDQHKITQMRKKLVNLRSTRTLEEIDEAIKEKIVEANLDTSF